MPWTDRVREGAYTAPDGTRLVFDFEDVGLEFDKKTSSYTFPEANGTLVQDLGHSGYRYPLRLWFSGADYDYKALAFEAMLRQQGLGVLEHPVYGVKNVIPFGTISRKDDLVTAANQCYIDVVFMETITAIWPEDANDPAGDVIRARELYNGSASTTFAATLPTQPMAGLIAARNAVKGAVAKVNKSLRQITNTVEDVTTAYNEIENSITQGIGALASAPGALAFQMIQLVTAPARAAAGIGATLAANANLLTLLLTTGGVADYATNDLTGGATVSASSLNVVTNEFTNKTDVVAAAEQIQLQMDSLVAWREQQQTALGIIDTGESYQALQELVALTVGYLVYISFTLKQEFSFVLQRPRTVVDLCAELYGSVDDYLDFFITSNAMTGEDIMELQPGREIKYYA